MELPTEESIQNSDFFVPVAVRSNLTLGKHESFPRIEASIRVFEVALLSCYFKQPVHAQQQRCRSACLEYHFVWPYEHGRFADEDRVPS